MLINHCIMVGHSDVRTSNLLNELKMLISACGQGLRHYLMRRTVPIRDREMSVILSAAEQKNNELLALSLSKNNPFL